MSKELELSKTYEKRNNVSATRDLIDYLEESIRLNKKKLDYFEEDYLKRKNEIDLINKLISDYNKEIEELNEKKKSYFGEINNITRRMEDLPDKKSNKKNIIENDTQDLSNSEKIKLLQTKAREAQYQINLFKTKSNEQKNKIENITPQFKIYEKDHKNIIDLILKDENRIKELKIKLGNEIKDSETDLDMNHQNIEYKNLKSKKEIEEKLTQIERELAQIDIPTDFFSLQNPQDLSKILKKIKEIKEKVNNKHDPIQIEANEKELTEIIHSFENLENLVNDLEQIVNKFLKEINLKSQILITIDKNRKNFFIELIFSRNEKEQINFEDLTTPEKIYFVISFYVSIEIVKKSDFIIFSNLYLPNRFNKRGSIERTLKKMLPLFNNEEKLLDKKLIFIISNLEIQPNIKNLKVIKIKES